MSKRFLHPDYPAFLLSLKERIDRAHLAAARVVNSEMIMLYWDIGRCICEKQQTAGWGDSVVEVLARDLQKAFPDRQGFSERNVWYMRHFFEAYGTSEFLPQAVAEIGGEALGISSGQANRSPSPLNPRIGKVNFLPQLVAEIPWGHHRLILDKVTQPAARLYYMRATAQLGWSRSVLLNQIKASAFERTLKENKSHNFETALTEHFADQADEILKSRYSLGFLGIGRAMKERDLENRLVARLQEFILELGYGFCFVGRQYRLALGRKEYFVDLLFYHRFLKALVAVDLKIGSFEPEHAGKMDFYLNLLNEKERAPDDQPSIGIILCAEKYDVEVEFSLKTKSNPIGVAEYQLQPTFPAQFKGKLPTAKQLVDALRKAKEER